MKATTPTLHLICGLPGSGKTTLAAKLEKELGALRLSPDDWMMRTVGHLHNEQARVAIELIQWEIAQKVLASGMDVILEFGFWSRGERDEYRRAARKLGAKTQLYYLDVPIEKLKRRMRNRNAGIHDAGLYIDPAKLDDWANSFEKPVADEFGSAYMYS